MKHVAGALGVVLVLSAAPAAAREYLVDLSQVVALDDLYDLATYGELSEDELDLLVALYNRPLNLNRADRYLLYDLPGITLELADKIIERRAQLSKFEQVEDLLSVEGIESNILEALRPFVTVDSATALSEGLPFVQGKAGMGLAWRKGFGRAAANIDDRAERETGPQLFLRGSGDGFDYFGAGFLATLRRRTVVSYDLSRGAFVSDGPADLLDLDAVYLTAQYGAFAGVLGSYTVGFGEGVVFDTTSLDSPDGWREGANVSLSTERGTISPDRSLFGAAVTFSGIDLPAGWIDATFWASSQEEDLYQYDFNYGLDETFPVDGTCTTDGQCPFGYTCGVGGHCVSSRIYQDGDLVAGTYRYETLYDAYRETLFGGHASYSVDERSRLGVTAWAGTSSWQLSELPSPGFSSGASRPNSDWYGAWGVDGRLGLGMVDLSAEYARTFNAGNAFNVRALLAPTRIIEITGGFRYYDLRYKNPFSRGDAAPDEAGGTRTRNEIGGELELLIKPFSGLELVTQGEIWRQLAELRFSFDGGLLAVPDDVSGIALRVEQRAKYRITTAETATLKVEFTDKDLNRNGRVESYEAGSLPESAAVSAEAFATCYNQPSFDASADDPATSDVEGFGCGVALGRGERIAAEIRLASKRFSFVEARLVYSPAWVDTKALTKSFDLQHTFRLALTSRLWRDGKVVASGAYWIHERDDDYDSDREKPQIDAYLAVDQKLFEVVNVGARYGYLHYIDNRDSRFSDYHFFKFTFDARF